MTENSDGIPAIDFVAKDIKNNRICVNGINDKFTAIKNHGKWKKGYPEFDDLMDYFSEEKKFIRDPKVFIRSKKFYSKPIQTDWQEKPGCKIKYS